MPTPWIPSLARIAGVFDQSFVLKDPIALKRNPVPSERAIAGIVRNDPCLLVSLLEGAIRKLESESQLQEGHVSLEVRGISTRTSKHNECCSQIMYW